jgi:hypothetical protein
MAIPTAAFMIVIVTRYEEMSLDLLRDFDDLALAAEARHYLDKAVQEDIARQK